MRQFAKTVLDTPVQILADLAEFWMAYEASVGIFVIPASLLEMSGNIAYLRRHSLHEIHRGIEQSIEDTIEKLIEFGYIHAHHLGELATYRREGSVVTITDAHSGNQIHIEWFDTEIDSIIEIESGSGERKYRDSITVKNQKLESTPIERKIGTVNTDLLKLLKSDSVNLLGCDFLPYIEQLRSIAGTHFTDFHRDDAISLGVDIPTIEHIDAFLAFLRENTEADLSSSTDTGLCRDDKKTVAIYTKFIKTVQEFVEFHKLTNT